MAIANAGKAETSGAELDNDGVERGESNVVREQKVLQLDEEFYDIIYLEVSKQRELGALVY